MDTNGELNHKLFLQREVHFQHAPADRERYFYEAVAIGDTKTLDEMFIPFLKNPNEGRGVLSKDPFRNELYHYIISVSMVTRFCLDKGMEQKIAYSLSDLYIQKGDTCQSKEEIIELLQTMVYDYADRMSAYRKQNMLSKPIVLCIDYIYDNLHEKITVSKLSSYVHLNENYLSKLFKKETGMTISAYIMNRRLEAAANMLKYSEYSYTDISNYLCFSSQSHFIQAFKKETGYTPKQYRNLYFRSGWDNSQQIN